MSMRRFSAILTAALLVGLVVIPVQRYRVQEMREPHPSVTSVHSSIPRINYIEQAKDIRRNIERKPNVKKIYHNKHDRSHFVEHEVVVRFSPRPKPRDIQAMLKRADAKVKRDFGNSMIIKSNSLSTNELMKLFAEHPDSIYAEPNYLLLPNRRPNDILYTRYQWNLPMIDMERSWDLSQGSNKVIIAVVDTGIDLDHPEFAGKLTKGYNVIEDTDNPMDDNGHGTHVAGIIAARANNGDGIAGITWNSRLMPIKAIGADGSGTAFDIAQGIRWATDNGADVINLSVGNYTSSAALRDACRYAYQKNVVLVAATGNDATDQPGYPAAYKEVFGVSAIDHNRERADFSNYGDYVDVVAPGVDIPSTYIYSDYAALSGTSMACPHVTAFAALIRSVNPRLSADEVMTLMRKTAIDLGTQGKDKLYGYGMINVNAALTQAKTDTAPLQTEPQENFGGLLNKFLLRLRFGL